MTFNLFIIFIVQLVISLAIIKLSYLSNLVDKPNDRKFHLKDTAFTGGIILAITYALIVFVTDFNNYFLNLIISSSFLAAMCGFIDDKYNVNPGTKILLQTLAIFFIINQGLYLVDIGTYEYIGKIKLGSFDKIFTILCVLLIMNASNYSDGIDGLLSLIGCLVLGSYMYILIDYNKIETAKYILLIIFPLIIHLIFNFNLINNFKVFLGDSGSNLLGFIFSFIAIYLYKIEQIHPAILIWPLAYLVYEFFSLKFLRIYFKKKIFNPSRDHLHYVIFSYKNKTSASLLIILALNILLSSLGILIFKLFGPEVSILLFIKLFFLYSYLRIKFYKK